MMKSQMFKLFILLALIAYSPNINAQSCSGGNAGAYQCNNIDLLSSIPLSTFGVGRGNDCWGWISPVTNKDWVLMGTDSTTAIVDISDPGSPIYVGKIIRERSNSTWRDIKVVNDHAYIGSEADFHGIQIFDLRQLDTITTGGFPRTFSKTHHYTGNRNSHNVVVNPKTPFVYVVGSNRASGGAHILDVSNPANPVVAGEYAAPSRAYTHDAQVVIYHGPDKDYQGRELYFGCNANRLIIADVTDKTNITTISNTTYSPRGYTHQGWLSPNHKYFYMNDETDELNVASITNTRTLVWDMTNLDNPVFDFSYFSNNAAIDHNLYTRGNYIYQSNYRSGLRILDAALIECDSLREIAFFDTYPANNSTAFSGSWSNYPYFDSVVAISDINRGLFVVKPNLPQNKSELQICGSPIEIETNRLLTVNLNFSNPNSLSNLIIKSPLNGCTYFSGSASNSGTLNGTDVEWNLGNYIGGTAISLSYQCLPNSITGTIEGTKDSIINDGAEGVLQFTASNKNGLSNWTNSPTNPLSGSFSYECTPLAVQELSYLELTDEAIVVGYDQTLEFDQSYFFANGDGGLLQISVEDGEWENVDSADFITNGFNSKINSSTNDFDQHFAFTGNSGSYIHTVLNLAKWSGYCIKFRFVLSTDASIASLPWYLDNIKIKYTSGGTPLFLELAACAMNTEGENASARKGVKLLMPITTPLNASTLEIEGKVLAKSFEIKWWNILEEDNIRYELYRRSAMEENFTKVANRQAHGAGTVYPFEDKEIEANLTYYYKVKVLAENGEAYYSETIQLLLEQSTVIKVVPNPNQGLFNLEIINWASLDAGQQQLVEISINNSLGQTVESFKINLSANRTNLTLDMQQEPKGVYFISINDGEHSYFEKIVLK